MQRTAVTIFISGRGSTPRMHGKMRHGLVQKPLSQTSQKQDDSRLPTRSQRPDALARRNMKIPCPCTVSPQSGHVAQTLTIQLGQ